MGSDLFFTTGKLIINKFRIFVRKECRFSDKLETQMFTQFLNDGNIFKGKQIIEHE
jgi:hypothetical protein